MYNNTTIYFLKQIVQLLLNCNPNCIEIVGTKPEHLFILTEEGKIGSDYRIDLQIEADLATSAKSDELKDTVDYVHLNKIVKMIVNSFRVYLLL